jgi:hypothetical protein
MAKKKKNPTVTTGKLTTLELVYPPISSQEASWFQNEPDAVEEMRQSDFYMIAARAEAKLRNFSQPPGTNDFHCSITVGDGFKDELFFRLEELPGTAGWAGDAFYIEAGEKFVRFWEGEPRAPNSTVLNWFTTEKLIWDRSRDLPGLYGFDRFREAAIYDLLYVGIAKVGDSFDRLVANGHKARMEILSNEPQRLPGARASDEVLLFLFAVHPLLVRTFDPEHEFKGTDLDAEFEHKPVVADAEKAFVNLLKPKYNVQRFSQYPRGKDGVYDWDLDRYVYAIAENLAFNTPHGRIRGGRNTKTGLVSNDADGIFIEGDSIKLHVAGVGFSPGRGDDRTDDK